MKKIIFILTAFMLFLVFNQFASAQPLFSIEGKVVDREYRPLVKATVLIPEINKSIETDPSGNFQIIRVPQGKYHIEVHKEGFMPYRSEVFELKDKSLTFDIVLMKKIMEEIVVTATRTDVPLKNLPVSVSVIPKHDIEKMHVQTVDDVLNKVEGVKVRRIQGLSTTGAHTSLFMRGTGDASRTLILKDGVPINTTYIGSVQLWNLISTDDIERVEVVRGASSALYGSNAMGGVINIVTRPAIEKLEGSASFEYGNLDTYIGNINLSKSFDKFGFRLSAGKKGTDGYEYLKPERWKDYYKTPENDLNNVSVGADLRLGQSTLKLDYEYFMGKSFKATSTQYDSENLAHKYTLDYSLPLGKTSCVGKFYYFNYGYTTEARKYNKKTEEHDKFYYDSDVPKDEWGLMLQASSKVENHRLSIGSDMRWGTCDSKYEYAKGPRDFSGDQNLYSVFVNDEISVGEKLILNAGMRYDWWKHHSGSFYDNTTKKEISIEYPEKTDSAFSPRGGITYLLFEDTKLRASFGTGFRVPGIYYLYRSGPHGPARFDLGNPELGPERMTYSFDIGFDTNPIKALDLSFTFYTNSFKDFMHAKTLKPEEVPPYFTPDPGLVVTQKINVGRVNIHGIEAGLKLAFNSHWSVFVNYTWNESKIKKYEEKPELEGNFISYTPCHIGNLGLTYHNPKLFMASIFLRGVGSSFGDFENTEKKKTDGYIVLDTKVSCKLYQGLGLFFNVDNLLDTEYTEYYYYDYAPPRIFMGGIKWTF